MTRAGAATAEHHARHSTTVLFLSVVLATAGILATQPSSALEGIAIPAPMRDTPFARSPRKPPSWPAAASGACRACSSMSTGVTNAVSGYAGGEKQTAHYEMVGSGTTGHAEAVQITYDPSRISYGKILQIFFSVAHDPTQLNRQGPDIGTQYRSAIFPRNAGAGDGGEGLYRATRPGPGVQGGRSSRRLEPDRPFYPAEDYHQDFLTLNPTYPYIVYNDLPKIENLKRLFPDLYRERPVLALQSSRTN